MRLDVDNLACRRSGRRIFAGLTFALEPGGALAVTGRNGAGKSSLLAILCGRLRPDAGRITVVGVGEATLPECLHAVGHRDGLKSALTAGENLTFARDLLGAARLTPRDALERMGLGHAHDLPVAYLSAGQRRRVALARLLVCARPLWLLDEPTAALDVASQEVLARLMAEHRAGGGLVIAATHQALGLTDAMELRIEPSGGEPAPPADEGLEDWT
ncbi:heme ABC exporter ATP-binding protein CcmA [Methylobacterium aerolatum]|uniref:Heme exporter protein A n=1 Tax=Methylobacterium aerolatum TaxID=418708 RepID=A0ABU0HZI4_9HYPH|nr:heme ABC exporter ATP-binding protein CcmA [Methylobacterium aerolatum]MDQ0447750.1 heme exporter protein A [Methylobacterium aerolatum]GJD34849.1 Cytochrome c biogenesis ATP-binding export protein CcmA [Methylobacterium aerolatum]